MNIKIESGAHVQITDKPIVNVFGDVNVGEKYKNSSNDIVETEYEEVKEEDGEQVDFKRDELNYTTPCIVLQKMLQKEWFDIVCSDVTIFKKDWRNKMVSDLMSSEYGAYIAKLWEHKNKIQIIKGKFVGSLVLAGVLKGSNLAIARAYLGIDKNTHDKDEKTETSTFANYMGLGRKEPYLDWIIDYVDKTHHKV